MTDPHTEIGTRDNVRALMRERQTILVFPGGSREVNKHRGQQYQLLWRERIGFARVAIEQGYPIVPFAAVGADEMLDVIIDQNTPIYRQFASLYEKLLGFPVPPIVRGLGPTPVPLKRAIILGIQFLRDERDQDPNRSLLARLRRAGVPRDPGTPRIRPRGVAHHRPET